LNKHNNVSSAKDDKTKHRVLTDSYSGDTRKSKRDFPEIFFEKTLNCDEMKEYWRNSG